MDLQKLKAGKFSIIYITTKDCNVGKVLKPKLIKLAEEYPQSTLTKIYLDDVPQVAGEFLAFAVPVFLVYSQGREIIRESRFLNMENIREKLNQYYKILIN